VRNMARKALLLFHRIMDNGPCKFLFLIPMACIAKMNPLLFQQPLVGTGMGIVTFPADIILIFKVLNGLLEHTALFIMAGETEGSIPFF